MIRFLIFALGLLMAPPLHAQHGGQRMHHGFGDAEKWSQVFDDPARDAWQKPGEVIAALKLAPDAAVADIGSGTGYFAVRLARAVPRGRVYGADIEPDMVKFLNDRAKKEGLGNLSSHRAAESGPAIPAPVDVALLVDTYHHIDRRVAYFEGLKKQLKPNGRVAIIDFTLESQSGPPREHRLAPQIVKSEMRRAGYRLAEEHAFLPNQYFLVFEPTK